MNVTVYDNCFIPIICVFLIKNPLNSPKQFFNYCSIKFCTYNISVFQLNSV